MTNKSDAKSRHLVSRAKRKNPDALIVACGCSVQNKSEVFKELGAEILVGNFNKTKIPLYIDAYLKEKETRYMLSKENSSFENMFLEDEPDKTRAFVKIQDGCNNFCSYCIIPYLRGNVRSKDLDEAAKEIKMLTEMGHKEIVLTGIHTGSYGSDKDYDLVDLIRIISKFDKLERIRISSIEVTELNDKFLDELKTNKKLVNHMHIPLQSGSDLILKKMNRKYDLNYFENKINEIRKIRPLMNITTDLIVGFPYETEDEWRKTIKFIKKIGFTKIHAFPFSLREGTKAEKMKDYFVREIDNKTRMNEVMKLSSELEKKYYKKFLNKELFVIAENNNRGHSENYILIHFDKNVKKGEKVRVLVTDVNEKCLGKILYNNK